MTVTKFFCMMCPLCGQLAGMLADIGGIMGLYIGLSVVSVFELVDLIVDVTAVIIPCGKKSEQTQSKNGYQAPSEMSAREA